MDEQILRVMYGDMAGTRIVEVRIHSRSVKKVVQCLCAGRLTSMNFGCGRMVRKLDPA